MFAKKFIEAFLHYVVMSDKQTDIQRNDKPLSSKEAIDGNSDFQKQKKPTIENGFISITKNKTKWWRCTSTTTIHGKTAQCICIISNLKYQISNLKYQSLSNEQKQNLHNHSHVYSSIEKYLKEKTSEEKSNDLTKSLFYYTALANLSMASATSNEMRILIYQSH